MLICILVLISYGLTTHLTLTAFSYGPAILQHSVTEYGKMNLTDIMQNLHTVESQLADINGTDGWLD